jgi:hypothetical protein
LTSEFFVENGERLRGKNKCHALNTTDENGNFSIKKSPETTFLVVSYVGFETKKIEVTSNTISVVLKEVNTLKEVTITAQKAMIEEKVDRLAQGEVTADEFYKSIGPIRGHVVQVDEVVFFL